MIEIRYREPFPIRALAIAHALKREDILTVVEENSAKRAASSAGEPLLSLKFYLDGEKPAYEVVKLSKGANAKLVETFVNYILQNEDLSFALKDFLKTYGTTYVDIECPIAYVSDLAGKSGLLPKILASVPVAAKEAHEVGFSSYKYAFLAEFEKHDDELNAVTLVRESKYKPKKPKSDINAYDLRGLHYETKSIRVYGTIDMVVRTGERGKNAEHVIACEIKRKSFMYRYVQAKAYALALSEILEKDVERLSFAIEYTMIGIFPYVHIPRRPSVEEIPAIGLERKPFEPFRTKAGSNEGKLIDAFAALTLLFFLDLDEAPLAPEALTHERAFSRNPRLEGPAP